MLAAAATLGVSYGDLFVTVSDNTVWVNGEEVPRVGMPGAAGSFLPCDTFAVDSIEPRDWSLCQAGAALPPLAATNVLTVQAFNYSRESSDMKIDIELIAVEILLDATRDADRDGIPDAWEQSSLGGTITPAGADADGDGLSNEAEYVAGTSPTNGASCLDVDIALAGGRTLVSLATLAAAGSGYEGKSRQYALEQRAKQPGDVWQTFVVGARERRQLCPARHGGLATSRMVAEPLAAPIPSGLHRFPRDRASCPPRPMLVFRLPARTLCGGGEDLACRTSMEIAGN